MSHHLTQAEREERIVALAIRFRDGEFSETVYFASLFALGLRGDQIGEIVNHTKREIENAKRERIQ